MDKQNEKGMVDLLNQETKELQDNQKQIEEMARSMCESNLSELYAKCDDCFAKKHCGFWAVAKDFINAGYRKISENEVVLTRKEYQKYLAFKIIEPQVRGCLDRERELEKRLETISKKTATITEQGQADWLDGYKVGFRDGVVALRTQTVEKIDEICKEITEGK